MEINTIAIDLKVPENGSIKVLEMMPFNIAGAEGYKVAYGQDMWEDIIKPFLGEFGTVFQKEKQARQYKTQNRTDGHPTTRRTIICPRLERYQSDLFLSERNTDTHLVNDSAFMWHALDSKTIQNDVLTDFMDGYLPKTHSFIVDENPDVSAFIETECPNSEIILKPDDQAGGTGIRLYDGTPEETNKAVTQDTNKNALRDRIYNLFTGLAFGKMNMWTLDPPLLAQLQDYIPSAGPIVSGKQYDGTMRVFMSLYRNNEGDDYKVAFHGSYWKLPQKSVTNTFSTNNRISYSPSNNESHGNSFTVLLKRILSKLISKGKLSKYFIGASMGNVIGHPVDAPTSERVYADLKSCVPQAINAITQTTMEDFIAKRLASPNPVHALQALQLYFSNYMNTKYKDGYPQNLENAVLALYQKGKEDLIFKHSTHFIHKKKNQYSYSVAMRIGELNANYPKQHKNLFEQIDAKNMFPIYEALALSLIKK